MSNEYHGPPETGGLDRQAAGLGGLALRLLSEQFGPPHEQRADGQHWVLQRGSGDEREIPMECRLHLKTCKVTGKVELWLFRGTTSVHTMWAATARQFADAVALVRLLVP